MSPCGSHVPLRREMEMSSHFEEASSTEWFSLREDHRGIW
jgi:hypothetical protein